MCFWSSLPKPISGLAPMHDVTTFLFRELQCQIAKPDVIFSEFISAEGLTCQPDKFANQLMFSKAQKPIVCQLFGINPKSFASAITIAHQLGFDGIDINMGCPAPKVLKNGGGGALIGDYNKVDKLLTAAIGITNKLRLLLSVKTRIVLDDKKNRKWFTFLATYPLTAIAIHGRDIKQAHHGFVDWRIVRNSANILKKKGIIVLGNGGINNREEGINIFNKYNLDGFLIGQAAIGNPCVFSISTNLTSTSYQQILSTLIKIIEGNHTVYSLCDLKKFILLSLKGWPNSSSVKQEIANLSDLSSVLKVLQNYLVCFAI